MKFIKTYVCIASALQVMLFFLHVDSSSSLRNMEQSGTIQQKNINVPHSDIQLPTTAQQPNTAQQDKVNLVFNNTVQATPPIKKDPFDCQEYVGQELKIRMASLSRYDFMRNIIAFANAKVDRYIESLEYNLTDIRDVLALLHGKTNAQFSEQSSRNDMCKHPKIVYIINRLTEREHIIVHDRLLHNNAPVTSSFAESIVTVFLSILFLV